MFCYRNTADLSPTRLLHASLEATQRIAAAALNKRGGFLAHGPIKDIDIDRPIFFHAWEDSDGDWVVDIIEEGVYEERMARVQADGVW